MEREQILLHHAIFCFIATVEWIACTKTMRAPRRPSLIYQSECSQAKIPCTNLLEYNLAFCIFTRTFDETISFKHHCNSTVYVYFGDVCVCTHIYNNQEAHRIQFVVDVNFSFNIICNVRGI